MSHKKSKITHTLDDIIHELTNLANDLAVGKLHVGSHQVTVNNPVSFKLKQKLKDDIISYDISFQLPLTHDSTESQLNSGEHSIPGLKTPAVQRSATSAPASSKPTKKPKKEISRLWKDVMQSIADEKELSQNEVDQLRAFCNPDLYAGKKWHNDWIICCRKVNDCMDAALQGNTSLAAQLVVEVKELTRSCHKQYK